MGEQHRVDAAHLGVEKLLAQVGRGVDQKPRRRPLPPGSTRACGGSWGSLDRTRPTRRRCAARPRTGRSRGSSLSAGGHGLGEQAKEILGRALRQLGSTGTPFSAATNAAVWTMKAGSLVAPAHRHRREIGRVGLDQQPLQRQVARDRPQRLGVLEGHDPGKRDVKPDFQCSFSEFPPGAEAMDDAAWRPFFAQNLESSRDRRRGYGR